MKRRKKISGWVYGCFERKGQNSIDTNGQHLGNERVMTVIVKNTQ